MTTIRGLNVRVEVATAFGTAKPVTGITKASPAVVTSTAHALANNTVGFFTIPDGMVQIHQQAGRVKNQTANTFEVQSLNTAGYSDFVDSSCLFTPATTWGVLSESIGYSYGGGSINKLDDTCLIHTVAQEINGLLPADTVQIDTRAQTFDSVVMQKIVDAFAAQQSMLFRITLHDGAVRVFYGEPSRPGESVQVGQTGSGQLSIAVKGQVLRGAA